MRSKLYVAPLLATLASACSTVPEPREAVLTFPGSSVSHVATHVDAYEIIAGAAGGEFHRWAKQLNGELCYGSSVVVIEEIRPHPEWMSLLNINLGSRDHKDWMSLALHYDPDTQRLWLVTQVPPDHEPLVTDEGFDVGEEIALFFSVVDRQVMVSAVSLAAVRDQEPGVPRQRYAYPVDYDDDIETVSLIVSGAAVKVAELKIGVDCRPQSAAPEPTPALPHGSEG